MAGGRFEAIIPRTIDEVAAIDPDVLVPGRCTGWRAIHQLAVRLPDAYLPADVDTCYHFTATQESPAN